MTKRLRYPGLALAKVMMLSVIAGPAFGQDGGTGASSGAGTNRGAGANGGSGAPVRGGRRGGDGLSGTGSDFGAGTPAATLARPTTPSKTPDLMGFIQRWMVLEPIPATGLTDNAVRATVGKEYFPDQLTVVPRDGDKVSVNGQELIWHAEETSRYNLNLFHFARALRKPSGNALFWVVTVVNCPEEVKDARLAVGSNAASVWWVNGNEAVALYGDRQTIIDDGVSKRLTLKKGPNIVRGAVINAFGATDFCARLLDAQDKPITAVTITLEVPAAGTPGADTPPQKDNR
jgi:hypothetical protein